MQGACMCASPQPGLESSCSGPKPWEVRHVLALLLSAQAWRGFLSAGIVTRSHGSPGVFYFNPTKFGWRWGKLGGSRAAAHRQ